MKLEAIVDKETHHLDLAAPEQEVRRARLDDGQEVPVDVRRVEPDVWSLLINGQSYECTIQELKNNMLRVTVCEATWDIEVYDPRRRRAGGSRGASAEGQQIITSPMPGRIVRLEVAVGDKVAAGQGIIIVEAMKMENELNAEIAGTVTAIKVEAGQTVEGDQPLVIIE